MLLLQVRPRLQSTGKLALVYLQQTSPNNQKMGLSRAVVGVLDLRFGDTCLFAHKAQKAVEHPEVTLDVLDRGGLLFWLWLLLCVFVRACAHVRAQGKRVTCQTSLGERPGMRTGVR